MGFASHTLPAFLLITIPLAYPVYTQDWEPPVQESWDSPAVDFDVSTKVLSDRLVAEATGTPQAPPPPVPDSQHASTVPLLEEEGFFRAPNERQWTVYAEAVFLQRSRPNDTTLITNNITPQAITLLNANDFSFDTEAGYRIGIILNEVLDTGWGLEGIYYNVNDWDSRSGVIASSAGAAVRYMHPIGHTTSPARIAGGYLSELENFEVNARLPVGERFNFLAGVRYMEVKDALALALNIGNYYTILTGLGAKNELMGFQIGADGIVWRKGRVGLGYLLKAGIFRNATDNQTFAAIASVPDAIHSSASKTHTALVGETGLMGVCHLGKGLAIRGGYQVLWIEGVALASDQMAVSDPLAGTATVDMGGSLFYHGAFVGLEISR